MTFAGHLYSEVVVPSGVVISATNGGGGPTNVTWTADTYESPAAALTQLIADLNSTRAPSGGDWTGSVSTGASGTGKVTIDCPDDTWSISWTSTAARDFLGFAANISSVTTAQTGTKQVRGLWMPDCPIMMDASYLATPRVTDMRQTEAPTGFVISHVGNLRYRHRNVRWQAVRQSRVWLASETVTNESLERFLIDTQWGLGHAWFAPGSKCIVVAHDGNEVGNGGVAGWYLKGIRALDEIATRQGEAWDGIWTVAIPELGTDS